MSKKLLIISMIVAGLAMSTTSFAAKGEGKGKGKGKGGDNAACTEAQFMAKRQDMLKKKLEKEGKADQFDAEWAKMEPKAKAQFTKADANSDGSLCAEEMKTLAPKGKKAE